MQRPTVADPQQVIRRSCLGRQERSRLQESQNQPQTIDGIVPSGPGALYCQPGFARQPTHLARTVAHQLNFSGGIRASQSKKATESTCKRGVALLPGIGPDSLDGAGSLGKYMISLAI